MKCEVCETLLIGKQTKYCSRFCSNQTTNKKHKNYARQQLRGLERKILLLKNFGMQCELCGYNKNLAALSFHHIDPSQKDFGIDIRACSNNNMDVLIKEANKCRLLCINCHFELHHPDFDKSSERIKHLLAD